MSSSRNSLPPAIAQTNEASHHDYPSQGPNSSSAISQPSILPIPAAAFDTRSISGSATVINVSGTYNDNKRIVPINSINNQTFRINDAPVRRVSDHFTGREKELNYLRNTIDSWRFDAPALFVIYGSPGRGKSQLALHYADQSFSSHRYSHIFWASATTKEKASQGMVNVLDLVDHKDRHHPEQSVRLRAARLWLENADRHGCPSWLFIFDNVTWDTIPLLLEHLPLRNGHGTILVTTRTLDIAEFITNSAKQKKSFLELQPLSSEQAVELFLKRAELDDAAVVVQGDVEKLVKKFGCLPLAVEQAGAYAKQMHVRIDTMQTEDLLRDILKWENTKQFSYEQNSVSAVFKAQLKNLDAISSDACNLLKTFAFFDPETIPLDILVHGAQRIRQKLKDTSVAPAIANQSSVKKQSAARKIIAQLPWRRPETANHYDTNNIGALGAAPSLASKLEPLIELMCSKTGLIEAMNHLEGLSLAQSRYGSNPSLHLHDLNQLVLLEQSSVADEAKGYHAIAITLLTGAFETIRDLGSPQSWAECESLVPHLTSLQKYYPEQMPYSREFMNMGHGIAKYLQKRGRYAEAETLLSRVLARHETVFGPGADHLDTLMTVHNLARVGIDQGHYDKADALYARALTGRMKQLGIDHPDTLMTSHDLALLRYRQGKHDEAVDLFTRVLAGQEKRLGPEHLDTLETAENLGNVYVRLRKHDTAKLLHARVLAGRAKQLGSEHPDTLTAMNILGDLYRAQGKYDRAEPLLVRVLHSRAAQLGAEHPHTLDVVHGLARLHLDQGRYDEADTMYARVLAGYEQQLGAEHPEALIVVHSIAVLREHQGRWEGAEQLYRRALAGMEKSLGCDHRETMNTVDSLACLYAAQGRRKEAEALHARIKETQRKAA
ncbi:hypothetical protein HWV62_31223 [Athelia sp. TMB]|nr:hypothetical protein HWV62_31223 [Athelia sp. TMB]